MDVPENILVHLTLENLCGGTQIKIGCKTGCLDYFGIYIDTIDLSLNMNLNLDQKFMKNTVQ